MGDNSKDEREKGAPVEDLHTSRRRFLKQAATASIAIAISSEITPVRGAEAVSAAKIYGYPARPSVLPGETLKLHFLTNKSFLRVRIYRQGLNSQQEPALVYAGLDTGWRPMTHPTVDNRNINPTENFVPKNAQVDVTTDWEWPSITVNIPAHWRSGAYIALLFAADSDQGSGNPPGSENPQPDGRSGKALFVVKNANPGTSTNILYKLALTTYHAYSEGVDTDGYKSSMYSFQRYVTSSSGIKGFKVTMLRPGGGTGAPILGGIDVNNELTPLNSFAHWDPFMIAWLERNNYEVDYCTDLDIHLEGSLLKKYGLLLSVGHDEYWSQAMRDNVEAFVHQGGNVSFFSGNTCFWRIHFTDMQDGIPTAFICDKTCTAAPPDCTRGGYEGNDVWWRTGQPENTLTGVSLRNAGDSAGPPNPKGGHTVQHANSPDDSWVYAGTGLSNGDVFGATEGLVAYECDGAEFREEAGVKVPTTRDGTPANFVILGYYLLTGGWMYYPREPVLVSEHAATMGYYTSIGTVFTGATTDWSRVLHSNNAPVNKITDNVIDGLTSRLKAVAAVKLGNSNKADIVFQNQSNAQPVVWYMNGATPARSGYTFHRQELHWSLRAVADFNGDGKPDFIFFNPTTGQTAIWYMDDLKIITGQYVSKSQDMPWSLVAAASFNNDGSPDLMFYNPSARQIAIWYMSGSVYNGHALIDKQPEEGWTPIAAADFNNDGHTDIILQHHDGRMVIWYLSGTGFVSSVDVPLPPDSSWKLVAAADFVGASGSDLLFQQAVTNQMMIWEMSYDQTSATRITQHPVGPVPTRGRTPKPTNLIARAKSATQVEISWTLPQQDLLADRGLSVVRYEVERTSSINEPFVRLTPDQTSPPFYDNNALPGKSYLYRVRAVFSENNKSAYSNTDMATTILFGELKPRETIIAASHLIELRNAVNAVRTLAALAPAVWTHPDPSPLPPRRPLYFKDVEDLRIWLDEALRVLGLFTPYSPTPLLAQGAPVSAEHFEQIRARVR
ncbi:MAG TPA: N,N-dimethylformamidase beta subunit family domain-containing protein [Pyrinomonadaceae bacterium]|nr:N,N-dimethylformamidase beta subunit family domain-containing protein [Pyrinomonadaceae bacterium]